jgi:isopenicillin-N epimerase
VSRAPGRPTRNAWARHWVLDPEVVFLNHGSFGACPRPILERQSELRGRLEAQPVRFFVRDLEALAADARRALAGLLGASPDDLAFVPNATAGVNTVLRSLELKSSDELLTTSQEYRACQNALEHAARRANARIVVAPVPFPLASEDQFIGAVLEHVTSHTRLALLDHITSPTALVCPIERLVAALSQRGIDTLVDGAHGPGQVPIDLQALAPAYYTGNCHKWLCAPKGAAFLYVRPDLQPALHPLSISHGASTPLAGRSRFRVEFDWTGTDDPTPFLCIPDCISFLSSLLPDGLPGLMEHNRQLALAARRLLCARLGLALPCPDSMVGSMAAIPLPAPAQAPGQSPLDTDPIQDRLWLEHSIEIPIMPWPEPRLRLMRLSAQLYNDPADYEALAAVLPGMLRDEAEKRL